MADIDKLKGQATAQALALKCYGSAMAEDNYLTIAALLDRLAAELSAQQQRAERGDATAERVRAAVQYLGPMGQGVLAALDGDAEVKR